MKKILFYITLVILLTGCSLFGADKTPPIKTYTLSGGIAPRNVTTGRGHASLLVSAPTAAPGYETTDMLYQLHPNQLSKYSKSQWIAPPAQLLLPLLTQSIQNAGCFRTVVSPPTASLTDYTLNTQLLVLRQEFLEDGHSCIRMTVEATLIDNATARPIAYRRFTTLVVTEENTPYGGVVATNQASANILRKITDFVCSIK